MPDTEKLVKRSGKVAFMDVGTSGTPSYKRMTKFTEMAQSKNAQEYSRSYVDEDGEVTDVTGYSPEIGYAFDQYTGNEVHEKLVDITDNEKTGADALVSILIVDLSKPASGGSGYEARLRTYSVIPDTEGDGTEAYTYSGTFRKNTGFTVGVATLSENNTIAEFEEDEVVSPPAG